MTSLTAPLLYADAYSGILAAPIAVVASKSLSSLLGVSSSILAIGGGLTTCYSAAQVYLLQKEGLSKRTLWLGIVWNVFTGVCGGIGLVQLQNLSASGKGVVSLFALGSIGVAGSALLAIKDKK